MKHHVIVKGGVVIGRASVQDPETTSIVTGSEEDLVEIDDPNSVAIGHVAKKKGKAWTFSAPASEA